MVEQIQLDRRTRDGKYGELMDVAEFLGNETYGSAVNALDAIAKDSPKFQDTIKSKAFQDWRKRQQKAGASS